MKGYTVYAKTAGMEIRATSKVSTEESATGKEGRIAIRFFTFGNGDNQSQKFILNPLEAYSICLFTAELAKKGGKQTLTHRFKGDEGEVTSRLTLEKWEKEDKSGYAYTLKRGESKAINVPMDMVSFLYVGELMKALSLEQAWSSYKSQEDTEAGETAGVSGTAGAAASGGAETGPVKK